MKFKIGDICTVKSGGESRCSSFEAEKQSKFIKITGGDSSYLYYNILNKDMKPIESCCGCFKAADLELYTPDKPIYKFKVGDRVMFRGFENDDCRDIINAGAIGTVVGTPSYINVQWDTLTKGHNCDGLAKPGTGYNVEEKYLELVTEEPNDQDKYYNENFPDAKSANEIGIVCDSGGDFPLNTILYLTDDDDSCAPLFKNSEGSESFTAEEETKTKHEPYFKVGDMITYTKEINEARRRGIWEAEGEVFIGKPVYILEVIEQKIEDKKSCFTYRFGTKDGGSMRCIEQEILDKFFDPKQPLIYKPLTPIFMDILKAVRDLTRTEPLKTYVKLGITDDKGDLTSEGNRVLLQHILEENHSSKDSTLFKKLKPIADAMDKK